MPALKPAAAVIAASTLALVAAAPAVARTHISHRVVPYRSIGGVPLKITPSQARSRFGAPSHVIRVSGKVAEYDYDPAHLSIQFDNSAPQDRADFIGINGGSYSTRGVRIGSPVAKVRAKFPGIKCSRFTCSIWQGKAGAVGSYATQFGLENGKVQEMDVDYAFE